MPFSMLLASGGNKNYGNAACLARIILAGAQAAAVYFLTGAAILPLSWPATEPSLFEPLLLAAVYVPLLVMLGVGRIKAQPLAAWGAVVAVIVIGLGYHDAVRGRVTNLSAAKVGWPWFQLWIALSLWLFVANVLVTASVIERRLRPSYLRHFDTAWTLGVQLVLSLWFVGVFWGVLALGAGLFQLINIDTFSRLLTKRWFALPATTLALAVAIHATDVHPALIRGARAMTLTLFSWLMPLLALIIFGFLISFPFVSLQPLWRSHFATGLLLQAALTMIFLINCCYQDGGAEQTTSTIKRFGATLGSVELVPLVLLSAWGLSLRVGQYGWSVERVLAAAVIIIASCYALGYATALIRTPFWLRRLEMTNWLSAYVFLVVVLALFSPLADPARLMVADQMRRLKSGVAQPDSFDLGALKFDGAGWGATALDDLRKGAMASNSAFQARVEKVLLAQTRYQVQFPPKIVSPQQWADAVTVYPAGRSLPPSLTEADFVIQSGISPEYCANTRASATSCFARYVALHPGQPDALVFVAGFNASVFEQDTGGQWHKVGALTGQAACLQALRSGVFSLEPRTTPDIVVDGHRLLFTPFESVNHPCYTLKR